MMLTIITVKERNISGAGGAGHEIDQIALRLRRMPARDLIGGQQRLCGTLQRRLGVQAPQKHLERQRRRFEIAPQQLEVGARLA